MRGEEAQRQNAKIATISAIVFLITSAVFWYLEDGATSIELLVGSRLPYQAFALFATLASLVFRTIQGILLTVGSVVGRNNATRALISISGILGLIGGIVVMNNRFWGFDPLWGLLLISDVCFVAMATCCYEFVRKHSSVLKSSLIVLCIACLALSFAVGLNPLIAVLATLGFTSLWMTVVFQIVGCSSGFSSELQHLTSIQEDDILKDDRLNCAEALAQIKELKGLLDDGVLTQEEYDLRKCKLLGFSIPPTCDDEAGEVALDVEMAPCPRFVEGVSECDNASALLNDDCGPEVESCDEQTDSNGGGATVKDDCNETELLREYKELFDSGVITQTEFNRKKAEILGFESDEQRVEREGREAEEAARRHRVFKTTVATLGVLLIAWMLVFLTTTRSIGLAIIVAGFLTVALIAYLILDGKGK